MIFRSMRSALESRPIYHKCDDTIRGHVFCSFLALVLMKELQSRLEDRGRYPEWEQIKRDLRAAGRGSKNGRQPMIPAHGTARRVPLGAAGCRGGRASLGPWRVKSPMRAI
jgi:hypothetical protein